MEALNQLHLLRPMLLLALPLWLLLVWGMWRSRNNDNGWSALCDPALLAYLVGDKQDESKRSRWLPVAWLISGVLMIIALAGPVWKMLPQPLYQAQSAMVIVLDLSHSMDAADLKPNRLQRAKQKLQDLLQARKEGQTGLIVFAGSAFDVVPLTTDNKAILSLLPGLDTSMMPVQGSRASIALQHALAMLKRGAIQHGSVVMLSDGVDAQATAVAEQLTADGHSLSILAVGTKDGAPIALPDGGFLQDKQGNIVIPRLQEDQLAALSARGGGIYQRIRVDDLDVKSLPGLNPQPLQNDVKSSMQTDQWREEGPWLLLLVLPLLALVFRRGALLLVIIAPLAMPQQAKAMTWQDLWQTPDQQGQALLQQGDAKAAAARFHNPAWKGAAEYRAGQFENAAKTLTHVDGADGWYNRGNALAKAGQLQQAIDAYDQALKAEPDHADAIFNRELVQKLLKKQQQQKKKQDQKQSKQGDKGKDGKESGKKTSGDQSSDGKPSDGKQADQQKQDEAQPAQSSAKEAEKKSAEKQGAEPGSGQAGVKKKGEQQPSGGAVERDEKSLEEKAARSQWLRRIPDDPGGLLRRKFKYQYQQQGNQPAGGEAW
ncbi:MAG: VWA domain-containing protein [Mariprofundus sp.]